MQTEVEVEKERRPSPQDAAGPALTAIRPASGWAMIDVRELWRFRELIYFLAWRDVKVRYKQTVLGAAWAVLQPALMMVVFTLVFSRVSRDEAGGAVPYSLFVLAGLVPWTFFASAIANAGNSIVGSERLITKVYFPRLAVPFATVAAAVVDCLFALTLLLLFMAWNWRAVTPGPGLLLAPAVLGLMVLTALGVGTLLAALNVAYRDFRYVIPFLVQLWMFATPSIYLKGMEQRTGLLSRVLLLNPMEGLVGAFRAAVLGGTIDWLRLGVAGSIAVGLFLVGCVYFRQVEERFADIV
ncbi:MAG TPA: ABC transporter permease [Gemmataceae bacterium]|nr:ABC transporter permease [Gemmataceae bacterium]